MKQKHERHYTSLTPQGICDAPFCKRQLYTTEEQHPMKLKHPLLSSLWHSLLSEGLPAAADIQHRFLATKRNVLKHVTVVIRAHFSTPLAELL
jgi:hypothetical protein